MRSITNITRWLHLVVATLAVWSQDFVQDLFKRLSIAEYYLLGVVLLAVAGMQAADRLAVLAIEKIRIVRVILAGRNDIEGDWVNIVIDVAKPSEIVAAEYCRIRYRGGQYVLTGDTWTLDGRWVQDFTTRGSSYLGREFEYYYRTGLNRVGGFGIIIFSPPDSLPTDFVCRYVDEDVKTPHVTRGRRVGRRFHAVSQDLRRDAALRFASTFDKKGLLAYGEAFTHYSPRL